MKTHIAALILLAGLFASAFAETNSTAAKPAAPQPGPELQRLHAFLGEWTYDKELLPTPLWPAMKSHGTMTGRPLLNGFVAEFTYREPRAWGEKVYLEIVWLDPLTLRFNYAYLDNAGGSETGSYTFDGITCSWEGTFAMEGKVWRSRGTENLSSDGMVLTQHAEISGDGTTWIPASVKTMRKVVATPAH